MTAPATDPEALDRDVGGELSEALVDVIAALDGRDPDALRQQLAVSDANRWLRNQRARQRRRLNRLRNER